MSRGLGRVQRQVLEALQAQPELADGTGYEYLSYDELAQKVYATSRPTLYQREAVGRAVRTMPQVECGYIMTTAHGIDVNTNIFGRFLVKYGERRRAGRIGVAALRPEGLMAERREHQQRRDVVLRTARWKDVTWDPNGMGAIFPTDKKTIHALQVLIGKLYGIPLRTVREHWPAYVGHRTLVETFEPLFGRDAPFVIEETSKELSEQHMRNMTGRPLPGE